MRPEFLPDPDKSGFFTSPNWPIMKLHQEGDFTCDQAWVSEAIKNHYYLKDHDDYLPGVIIGHTGKTGDEKPNKAFFDNPRLVGDTVFVDMIHMSPALRESIEDGQWPNRSVELLPRSKRIDRLALLGGTTPYFALPQTRGGKEPSRWYTFEGEKKMTLPAKDADLQPGSGSQPAPSPNSTSDPQPTGLLTENQLKQVRELVTETVVAVLEDASQAAGEAQNEPPKTVTTDNPAGKGYSEKEMKELREKVDEDGKIIRALRMKLDGADHRDYLKSQRSVGRPVGDDQRVEERVRYMLTLDEKQSREYKRTIEELPLVPTDQPNLGEGPVASDRLRSGETRRRNTIEDTKKYFKDNEKRLKGLGITEEELILSEHAFGGR